MRLRTIIILFYLLTSFSIKAQCPLDLNESTDAPSDNLLLYLPLDSSTTNLGSGSYTMNLSGASYVTTQCGSGLDFDGNNDYLEISPSMETEMDDDFTITAWIKLNSQTDKMGIFAIRDQCSSTYRGFSMVHFNFGEYNVPGLNSQVNFTGTCSGGSKGDRYNNPIISIENTEETFVALTVENNNTENRTVKLYVNCEEFTTIHTVDWPTMVVFDDPHDFVTVIGASSTTSGFYNTLDGVLDEFRIYTTVLDHEEILDVYQSCLPLEMSIENYTSCEGDSAIITLYNTEIDVEYQMMDITNNQLISPLLNGDCNELQFYTGLITDTTSFEIIAENQISNCSIVLDSVITLNPTAQSYFSDETIYLCEGDSILIEGTYYFSPITLSDTIPIIGNCDSILITTLVFNPYPLVDIGSDTTLCEGETLVLNAGSSILDYVWQDNSTEATFPVTEAGVYWVEVSENNCASSDTISIDYIPTPIVDLGNDAFLCEEDSILLDVTTPGYTYLWQDNSQNPTFLVEQEGIYWVEVSENNCSSRDTILISYPQYPPVYLGNDTSLCDGDVYILNTGSSGLNYLWQDNSTQSTFTVTETGSFWVDVDENGCISSDTINIEYFPVPFVDLGGDTYLCDGESILLDATTPNVTYLWQDNSQNPTFLVEQEGIYWVEINENNCSSRDTILISYPQYPPVYLGNDTSLCDGDVYILNTWSSDLNYLWQDNSTQSTFTVTETGSFWVDVNENGCISSDTINIEYFPIPFVDIGIDAYLCEGESILLDATTPNVTYLWQDNSTEATYYVDQEGLYHVSITENNCTYTDSIIITYPSYPPVNLGPDASMCDGELLILNTGSIDLIYLWQDNSSEPTLNVTQTGMYWVGVNENGCVSRDTINVIFNTIPYFNLGNDSALCGGTSLLLEADYDDAGYLWQDNSINSTFLVNTEGSYWVKVTDNNCSYTDTINIAYIYTSELNLGEDATICIGDNLILDATITNGNYIWQDNSTNPTYIVDGPGVYSVNAYNNCHSLYDSIEVTYIDCNCNIYMPNAFTPSGDGRNDFYGAVSDCSYDEFHLIIFNRWGEVVFESFDIQEHWNGAINEYYCPIGVYSYVLQYKNWNKGFEGEITGVVTLLR